MINEIEVNAVESGNYILYITDIYGCPSEKDLTILITYGQEIIVNNLLSSTSLGPNNRLSIYINPYLTFEEITVYDRWGNKVHRSMNAHETFGEELLAGV